tara:strand:+ start:79 stop:204 length:126 start_codon:yes stop_codon:yes gene_type:complete
MSEIGFVTATAPDASAIGTWRVRIALRLRLWARPSVRYGQD